MSRIKIDLLRKVDIFSSLPDEELALRLHAAPDLVAQPRLGDLRRSVLAVAVRWLRQCAWAHLVVTASHALHPDKDNWHLDLSC